MTVWSECELWPLLHIIHLGWRVMSTAVLIVAWIGAWQVVWVFLALDHDVDERLTSGCCHVRCICQLKCTVESMFFIILSLHSQFLAFFVSCTRHGSCVHRAVITGTVSSVAPSVSAHPAEPQDLFQMSGSNINSWTVANCVSLGIVARARELVNGSERRHRDGIAVRLQYDQCCFPFKWRETGFSLDVATCCSQALYFYCTFQVYYTMQCATCSSGEWGVTSYTLTRWRLLLAGCVVGFCCCWVLWSFLSSCWLVVLLVLCKWAVMVWR